MSGKTALTLRSVFEAVDRVSGPVRTMTGNVSKATEDMSAHLARTTERARAIGNALKGAAVMLATGAFAQALKSYAEQGDALARNASILGLSTDAYQELAYAAKMVDVDQDALTQGLKKMNVQVGQLRVKEGSLYTTLARINPALARQLRDAKSSDDAFNLLAAALGNETNVQKRATLAVAAFGKSGQDLIPLFDDLAAARQKAHEEGYFFSDDEIANAQRLDDTLKHLDSSLKGLKNEALSDVAEAAAPYLEELAQWLKDNKDTIIKDTRDLFGVLVSAGKLVTEGWKSGLIPTIIAAKVAFEGVKAAAAGAAIIKTIPFAASAVAGGAATAAEGAALAAGAGSAAAASAGLLAAPVIGGAALVAAGESRRAQLEAEARAKGDRYSYGSMGSQMMTAFQSAGGYAGIFGGKSQPAAPEHTSVDITIHDPSGAADVRQRGYASSVNLDTGRQLAGGAH